MAIIGTTIFSHILPAILGFFAVIFIISGTLDDNKPKLGLGIAFFIIACVSPYIVLSLLI